MPKCVADRMRRLTAIAGTVVLVMLGLLLWPDVAAAACPHDSPAAPVAAAAHRMPHAKVVEAADHGRYAPGRSHHSVRPCCAGMSCASVPFGLPGSDVVSPVGVAGPKLGWASGLLREGLGLRPALPPPRLG